MRKKVVIAFSILIVSISALCLAGLMILQVPALSDRVIWRLDNMVSRIRRVINPPEQVVFIPAGAGPAAPAANPENPGLILEPTSTPIAGLETTPTSEVSSAPATATSVSSLTLAPSPTAIPGAILLPGVIHEYQQFNNCGPANLAMALSFWGWQGDQRDTRQFLRPNNKVDDKNVMPAEMIAFVEGFTDLRAITRTGGDLDILRGLIAAGFPVLIEAGHHPPDDWWMGHYLVVNGYDDSRQVFTVQDSLSNPNLEMSYADLAGHWWRDFNYVYLVIFPADRESEISSILGSRWDERFSYELSAQKAIDESSVLQGRDRFFAAFNLGSSLVGMESYPAAAQAYDQAFEIYQTLSEELRPYRLMWYQSGPYQAYYETGRYQDVIDLANTTFTWVGQPVLEESYYWRGKAYLALNQNQVAISDFEKAARLNPNYAPPRLELNQLGASLP